MEDSSTEKIINSFKSFNKETYSRDEQLPELKKLERELVEYTLKDDDKDHSNLRIRDAERYLEKLNESLGSPATEELHRFIADCKDLCSMTKGIISGFEGENKVFAYLKRINGFNKVLRNVELNSEYTHTELDAVVITKRGVTIVEVKNSSLNVEVDEDGNYFRVGRELKYDSNLKEKMSFRGELIRTILKSAGYENVPLRTVVVFTNDQVKINAKCRELTVCNTNTMLDLINQDSAPEILSEADVEVLSIAVNSARREEVHKFDFDAYQMKKDFAELMVKLDQAAEKEEIKASETVTEPVINSDVKMAESEKKEKTSIISHKKKRFGIAWNAGYRPMALRFGASLASAMSVAAFGVIIAAATKHTY